MQQPPWMAEAWALFGASEIAGPRANSRIADLYRDAGHASVRDDAVPWCAAFVGACLKRAGIRPTGSLRARSYLKFGVAAEVPKPGDVVVLTRGASPTAGHVGFLVGETETRVLLLGGNQSNAVTVAAFSRDRILGFRRPALDTQQRAEASTDQGASAEDAFAPCLAHVLRMEGGYVNDPYDPGGPTHRGITLATFARYRKTPNFTEARRALVADLKAIKDEEVRAIYEAFYWRPSRAQEMPAGVDLMHFDASVNHGLTGAARLLQSTLGVTVDGEIGPVTMGALRASDPSQTIAAYADARARRYRSLRHFWRFGRG
ncbi:MAG: TIGR02594 family protein, partial [Pseudomonadota bacterium]